MSQVSLSANGHDTAFLSCSCSWRARSVFLGRSFFLYSFLSSLLSVSQLEGQVKQLEDLKAALESELDVAYTEREELAAALEAVRSEQHDDACSCSQSRDVWLSLCGCEVESYGGSWRRRLRRGRACPRLRARGGHMRRWSCAAASRRPARAAGTDSADILDTVQFVHV